MHTRKRVLLCLVFCHTAILTKLNMEKTIFEIFKEDVEKKIFNGTFIILNPKYDQFFLKYFEDVMKEW